MPDFCFYDRCNFEIVLTTEIQENNFLAEEIKMMNDQSLNMSSIQLNQNNNLNDGS